MARIENEQSVTLTVIDRLVDREPDSQVEAPLTRSQSIRALKAGLRRDLEWLLNTRRTPVPAGDDMPQVANSLYNYGLPDFTSMSFANIHDRARLLRMIENTINLFEPRLEAVRVTPVEAGTSGTSRILRFQIEGLLKMDPAPEHISFDTVLQLTSGEYQIKGDRSA